MTTDIINGIDTTHLSPEARAVRSITAKRAQMPPVDHNGKPIEGELPIYTYDTKGKRIS